LHGPGIIVLRILRNDSKSTPSVCQKGRKETFLKPGKYSQASTRAHPSVDKLNPVPGRIVKRGPREYTHIHMGVHEDIQRKGGRRDS
jgi:hypothetical protein